MAEYPPQRKEDWSPKLVLNGEEYNLIRVQRRIRTAIYKGDKAFVRIGDPEFITRDLALHQQMEQNGFPIAHLLGEGAVGELRYFTEESLGDDHFGNLFAKDMESGSTINEPLFDSFLNIGIRFAEAQLRTIQSTKDFPQFANGIHLDVLCEEMPNESAQIQEQFNEVQARLTEFPFVVTHGDFNPHNIFPKGVIDLEESFMGPFGYDVISALVHIDYMPDEPADGYYAKYRFTEEQKVRYLQEMDFLFNSAGLPSISTHLSDFEFCRAAWLLVRLQKYPNLQKFRFDLFKERFLS